MKAFVITLKDNQYSESKAARCIETARDIGGIDVEMFFGVPKTEAWCVMEKFKLAWTWANNNTQTTACPISGLQQHPYKGANLDAKIGCAMSHFLLWKRCVELNEPLLILEHDAVFLREFPDFDFDGICQINDPFRATPRGKWWSDTMKNRNEVGVFPKTIIRAGNERYIPDGLAGNSAYVIKPWAARELIDKYYELGVWPNDATMCIQLFPYLQEYYPFITKVDQEVSTSSV